MTNAREENLTYRRAKPRPSTEDLGMDRRTMKDGPNFVQEGETNEVASRKMVSFFVEECILLYLMRSEPTARPNVLFLGGRGVQRV